MQIKRYSNVCDLRDFHGTLICRGRRLSTPLKLLLSSLGCFLGWIFYLLKSPFVLPKARLLELGVNPEIAAQLTLIAPFVILIPVLALSILIVSLDDYEHGAGAFFASIGVPPIIFSLLRSLG